MQTSYTVNKWKITYLRISVTNEWSYLPSYCALFFVVTVSWSQLRLKFVSFGKLSPWVREGNHLLWKFLGGLMPVQLVRSFSIWIDMCFIEEIDHHLCPCQDSLTLRLSIDVIKLHEALKDNWNCKIKIFPLLIFISNIFALSLSLTAAHRTSIFDKLDYPWFIFIGYYFIKKTLKYSWNTFNADPILFAPIEGEMYKFISYFHTELFRSALFC